MACEGALEGRDDDAALEGPGDLSLREGLAPGLDRPLQIVSQCP